MPHKKGMHYNSEVNNPNWKGGKTISSGKVRVLCKGHPRANSDGYVFEHILVAEKALGDYLPKGAEVHHIDKNTLNNDPTNLVICQDRAAHAMLHQRLRSYEATGHPDYKHCSDCDTWKPLEDFYSKCQQCKPCRDRRHKKYMETRKEAARATS